MKLFKNNYFQNTSGRLLLDVATLNLKVSNSWLHEDNSVILQLICHSKHEKTTESLSAICVKGIVMQTLINDRLRVSKASWKFCISTIYNFTVICLWNLPFSYKVASFKKIMLPFLFIKKDFQLNTVKTKRAMNAKVPVFVDCVEVIIYLLLYKGPYILDVPFKIVLSWTPFSPI